MQWSSAKVRDKLMEAWELNGLFCHEMPAAYTSRQDSRTATPGQRCKDVSITEFRLSPFWQKQINQAERMKQNERSSRQEYLLELHSQFKNLDLDSIKKWPPIRIPVNGGEVFMSVDGESPIAGGLNADFNAASNIALRAILDPDWPGTWWKVPVQVSNRRPKKESVQGSACIDTGSPLSDIDLAPKTSVINFWRDPSVKEIHDDDAWESTQTYWRTVEKRVIQRLRVYNKKRFKEGTSNRFMEEDHPF